MKRYIFVGCVFLISGLALSCGKQFVTVPDLVKVEENHPVSSIWGFYEISIEPDTLQVDVVPLRTALFEANVTRFLQPPSSPIHLLSISILPGTDFSQGKVVCNVTLKHPFPGSKYAGFDVKGIVMGPGGISCQWDSDLKYADSTGVRLLNADGWTRWWNEVEFLTKNTIFGYTEGALANHSFHSTTTLNPYKYFADELDAESPISDVTESGRGFFSSETPGVNTRKYELQFPTDPMPEFKFKYGVSASWIEPLAGASPPWTADDFALEANQPEAFRVEVIDNGSTAYYEGPDKYGGGLNLIINISDWQLLGGTSPEDEIAGVFIESPTLFPGVLNVFDPNKLGPGPDAMSVSLSVNVDDVTPTGLKDQILIVHVASAHPTTYEPQVPGGSGFIWPKNAQLAAHLIWNVPIKPSGPSNEPPVADASASNPLSGPAPLTVHLDPSLSYDPDGTIVLYEWDFENDGAFDVSTFAPEVVDKIYPTPGTYYVNLRVTDDGGLTDTLDTPLEINVQPPLPTWTQLQDDPAHVGEVLDEPELHPPLKLVYQAKLSATQSFTIEGSPIIGSGVVMVLYGNWESNWAEGFDFYSGEWLWKVNLSPNIRQSYIGTQTGAYGDGRFYVPGDAIRALDPATGAVLWTYTGGGSYESERHGLVFVDGKVMVHLGANIHIIDASNGTLIDTVTVGAGDANFQPFTLRDNIAYIQYWATVKAFNLQTKTMLWSFLIDPIGGDLTVRNAPTVPGDGRVYFGAYNGFYYALNAETGALVWKTPIQGGTQRAFDTAAVADGRLFFGEGWGQGTISRFVCLDTETGAELWAHLPQLPSTTMDKWLTCSPIVVNGVVYAGHTTGEFVALDAETGEVLWTYFMPASACTDPVVAGGRLFVISDDRTLWCFESE